MKLAFCIYKYFPYGGLQRDFLRIIEIIAKQGHSIRIYTREWQGERLLPEGCELVVLNCSGISNHSKNKNFYLQVKSQLEKHPVDKIVGFDKMPGLDFYYQGDTCYRADTKDRSLFYKLTPRYRQFCSFEEAVFHKSGNTKILLLSKVLKPVFKHYYQTEEERFYLLPPGIAQSRKYTNHSPNARRNIRKLLGIDDAQFLLLQVGSDFKRKGVDRSLLAMASLSEDLRKRTFLCVIGQDDASRFQHLAKKLGISSHVFFLSGRDDVDQFIAASDLFLHPARSENTGTVILEALVGALPQIVTENCGYSSYVKEADTGIVIPSSCEINFLAQALENALEKPDQLIYWQDRCKNYADSHDLYSLHKKAAEIILTES